MTHEEATKNHAGGENDKPSTERETRLYSTEEPDNAFSCLKWYLPKLNPLCKAFFQRPTPAASKEDPIWYENNR